MTSLSKLFLTAVICVLLSHASSADTIAIIGTGKVASALGPGFSSLGHEIVYGSRNPDRDSVKTLLEKTGNATATTQRDAVKDADIVVLAIPRTVVRDTLRSLGSLSGKIVIDVTNPATYLSSGYASHTVDSSNGELIQRWVPRAKVVKAFNTLSYRTMADPGLAGGPVTIPIVGNDAEAKAKVIELAEGIGFEAIDLGPIEYAHEVEGMLILWLNAQKHAPSFDFHLRRHD